MYGVPDLDELKGLIHLPVPRPLLLVGVGDRELLRSRMRQGRWKRIIEEKLRQCDMALENPIPQLPHSLYDDYIRAGRRHPFEAPYFQRRRIAEDLALAYILTEKPEYLDRCRDYIWSIMEEFTWVIPAHARGPFQPSIVTLVDLFSSGTALLLADLWDVLHEDLDRETLEWMRESILRRVLIPLREHYDEQGWTRRYESNWCGVCCGNSGCALILTALNEPWAVDLLHRLLRSIDGFLATADPGGAWVEGVGYWFYGFSRVVFLADLLAKVTKGRLDLLEDSRIEAAASFPVWTYMPPRSCVNFEDTSGTPSAYPEVLARFAERYRNPVIMWYIQRLEDQGLLGGGSLRDLLWPPPSDLQPSSPESWETAKWYRRIGVIITRSSWIDPDAAVLAVKAGHNAEPHNHLDVGQFIYHRYGHSYICDLGVGVYDRDYFGLKRYENPVCGAEGHNLVFIDGRSQVPGREYEGKIVEYCRETDWERIVLNLTAAYPSEVLSKAVRTLYFLKPDGLVLIDEVKCREGAEVELRLHANGDVRLSTCGAVISAEKGSVLVALAEPASGRIQIGAHKGLRIRGSKTTDAPYISLLTRAVGGHARIQAHIVPCQNDDEREAKLQTIKLRLEHIMRS